MFSERDNIYCHQKIGFLDFVHCLFIKKQKQMAFFKPKTNNIMQLYVDIEHYLHY